jgi:hypothetical protein
MPHTYQVGEKVCEFPVPPAIPSEQAQWVSQSFVQHFQTRLASPGPILFSELVRPLRFEDAVASGIFEMLQGFNIGGATWLLNNPEYGPTVDEWGIWWPEYPKTKMAAIRHSRSAPQACNQLCRMQQTRGLHVHSTAGPKPRHLPLACGVLRLQPVPAVPAVHQIVPSRGSHPMGEILHYVLALLYRALLILRETVHGCQTARGHQTRRRNGSLWNQRHTFPRKHTSEQPYVWRSLRQHRAHGRRSYRRHRPSSPPQAALRQPAVPIQPHHGQRVQHGRTPGRTTRCPRQQEMCKSKLRQLQTNTQPRHR